MILDHAPGAMIIVKDANVLIKLPIPDAVAGSLSAIGLTSEAVVPRQARILCLS